MRLISGDQNHETDLMVRRRFPGQPPAVSGPLVVRNHVARAYPTLGSASAGKLPLFIRHRGPPVSLPGICNQLELRPASVKRQAFWSQGSIGPSARSPSSHCNVTLCWQLGKAPVWQNDAGALHLSTKQAELLRVLFSMGLTAFIGAGTFVVIRYLTGLSE